MDVLNSLSSPKAVLSLAENSHYLASARGQAHGLSCWEAAERIARASSRTVSLLQLCDLPGADSREPGQCCTRFAPVLEKIQCSPRPARNTASEPQFSVLIADHCEYRPEEQGGRAVVVGQHDMDVASETAWLSKPFLTELHGSRC